MSTGLLYRAYHLFEDSDIPAYDRQKDARILEAIVNEHHIAVDDVLALSTPNLSLMIVHRGGVIFALEVGVLRKRIETGTVVSFSQIQMLVPKPSGRFASAIDAIGQDGRRLFEAKWETGGPIRPEDARRERDRIVAIVRSALGSCVS